MRDLICDVINYCARNCDVGKIRVHDEILIENLEKNVKIK